MTTRRVNVNFSESTYNTLKDIAERKGKTMAEVLRDAIALEDWFTKEQKDGNRILIERKGEVREIIPRS